MTRMNAMVRCADLVLLALSAPVWIPVLAVCAVAVGVGSGFPVFFRQERVGLHGEVFRVVKFRSMRTGTSYEEPNADSITRIGGLLRRTSLDELPQILNVLSGEMSMVGPRPMLPAQTAALSTEQSRRHDVRPGLTGLAQISGRNSIPWADRLAHDVDWASAPTLARYVRIVARTFVVVPTGDGVDGNDVNDPFVRLVYEMDAADADTIELTEVTDLRANSLHRPVHDRTAA